MTDRLEAKTPQEIAREERSAKKRAEEAEQAAKDAERDRLAYLRRTGRTEMKP